MDVRHEHGRWVARTGSAVVFTHEDRDIVEDWVDYQEEEAGVGESQPEDSVAVSWSQPPRPLVGCDCTDVCSPRDPGAVRMSHVEVAADRLSVLVIEDHRDAADTLALFLEYVCGWRVRIARDGAAGVRAAAKELPDAVVCDIGLPKKDGYQVAAELSARPRRPLLVALTAYGDDAARERARKAGFDHYLVKPADPEEVEDLIRTHCNGAGARRPGEPPAPAQDVSGR